MKMGWLQLLLLLIAISAVALADVAFKKASLGNDFKSTLFNWWTVLGVGLYLFQIVFFLYLFSQQEALVNVGTYQTVIYAIITIASGVMLFKEQLTTTQAAGIVIAVMGVVIAQR